MKSADSGFDPTRDQLVKDFKAAHDRAEAIRRKAHLPATKVATFDC